MIWITGAILTLTIVVIFYYCQLLTIGGTITSFFIGWIIFSLGKLTFSIPILVFFVSSNILSKIGRSQKSQLATYFQKTNQRDLGQVLANGCIPVLLLLGWSQYQNPIWMVLYWASLASATADTWATEFGVLSKSEPRSILNFKKVQKGTSGAVSLLGLIAAASGALIIAFTGYFTSWLELSLIFSWKCLLFLTIIGFVAQTFDSILGASAQVQYSCFECGKITERKRHCSGNHTKRISGFKWMDNDMVNFLSNLSGVLIGWMSYRIFI
ncbi:MAG: DUF92 domain-containing protein [bacterium]